MDLKTKLDLAEKVLPIPVLWQRLGLPIPNRIQNFDRPFETWVPWRESEGHSKRPSLRVFPAKGTWFFKDMARGESGTALKFYALCRGIEVKKAIPEFLQLAGVEKNPAAPQEKIATPRIVHESSSFQNKPPSKPKKPRWLRHGTEDQLKVLSSLRKGISISALRHAQRRGWLSFGEYYKNAAWWIHDSSGWVYQCRRMDGNDWPAKENRQPSKSLNIYGSKAEWPLALDDIKDCETVAVVEGGADFLACIHFLQKAELLDKVAPIAFLGASNRFNTPFGNSLKILDRLRGKQVLLFPDNDEAGLQAAQRWQEDLGGVAKAVHAVDMGKVGKSIGVSGIKDLNDLVAYDDRFNAWKLFGHFVEPPKRNPSSESKQRDLQIAKLSGIHQINLSTAGKEQTDALLMVFHGTHPGTINLLFNTLSNQSTQSAAQRIVSEHRDARPVEMEMALQSEKTVAGRISFQSIPKPNPAIEFTGTAAEGNAWEVVEAQLLPE